MYRPHVAYLKKIYKKIRQPFKASVVIIDRIMFLQFRRNSLEEFTNFLNIEGRPMCN